MPGSSATRSRSACWRPIDPAAIHALGADCVVYMPRALEIEHVVALLEAGTNVVTTRGELFGGAHKLGEDRQRILDACDRGNASIYATGSSPGFITEVLPFALLSMQRHVECIEIDEFADMSQRDSPNLLFELMGFGLPLDSYNPARAAYLVGEFGPSLAAARRRRGPARRRMDRIGSGRRRPEHDDARGGRAPGRHGRRATDHGRRHQRGR